MTIIQDIRNTESRIQEREQTWNTFYEWWQQRLLSAKNQREYSSTYKNFQEHMEIFQTECTKLYEKHKRLYVEFDEIIRENVLKNQEKLNGPRLADMELHEIVQNIMIGFLQDQGDFMDGQEPTTIIDPEIDNKKSDEQSHQFIESVETENPVDCFIAGIAASVN